MDRAPTIVILGANGLIGFALTDALLHEGLPVVAAARSFTPAQRARLGTAARRGKLVHGSEALLADLLGGAELVVNCIGVLQDGPRGRTADVHRRFVQRLLREIEALPRPALLVQLSIPGRADDDATPFSVSKREAEHLIAASRAPSVVLRPGFVIADAAFGGSALVRALAALRLSLPPDLGSRPFAITAVEDLAATLVHLARRWHAGEWHDKAVWDVMAQRETTVDEVVAAFRARQGSGASIVHLPDWTLGWGAAVGDAVSRLGWIPPVRTTALRELRRGVAGDPSAWIAATGLTPTTLEEVVARRPATIQEAWFGRLYLLKGVVLGSLAGFWMLTGVITLAAAFEPARELLIAHGIPPVAAGPLTTAMSFVDIVIGSLVACRGTCRAGLLAGMGVAVGYLVAATMLAPALWLDPLGSLVKIVPALVLMLVGWAIVENR